VEKTRSHEAKQVARLSKQIDLLLDDLEKKELEITFPQRLNALIAVGRVMTIFAALRAKAAKDDAGRAGSTVRAYTEAFALSDASRRRAAGGGPEAYGGDDPDVGANSSWDVEDDESAAH
jgi:hypothetical protein